MIIISNENTKYLHKLKFKIIERGIVNSFLQWFSTSRPTSTLQKITYWVPPIPISLRWVLNLIIDVRLYHTTQWTLRLYKTKNRFHDSITPIKDFKALSPNIVKQNLCLVLTKNFRQEYENPLVGLIFNVYKNFELNDKIRTLRLQLSKIDVKMMEIFYSRMFKSESYVQDVLNTHLYLLEELMQKLNLYVIVGAFKALLIGHNGESIG